MLSSDVVMQAYRPGWYPYGLSSVLCKAMRVSLLDDIQRRGKRKRKKKRERETRVQSNKVIRGVTVFWSRKVYPFQPVLWDTKRQILPENQAPCNTTHAAEADEGSAREGTLPLAADVIGLVRHDSGDVGVGAGRDEEDAKVADGRVLVPADDGQADEAKEVVEDDDGPADAIAVAEPAGGEHDDAGQDVGRSHEAVGLDGVEVHALLQDDGEEVGQGVRDGSGVEEDHGVGPDLPVTRMRHVAAEVEGQHLRVATVAVHLVHHPRPLPGAQEVPSLALRIWEVDQQPVPSDAEEDGDEAFDDEDPPPAAR